MASSDPELLEALRTLVSVLSKYGYKGHTDRMQEALHLYESGSPAFDRKIASAEIWGGAGSVSDMPIPQGTPDRQLFFQAMITLADYINAQMIGPQQAREQAGWIASIFRQWLAQGL
jgi:hypothetical protein